MYLGGVGVGTNNKYTYHTRVSGLGWFVAGVVFASPFLYIPRLATCYSPVVPDLMWKCCCF